MKNQNFGDNRDLLKFDLAYQIVNEGLSGQFSYIPMLTARVAEEEAQLCRHNASGGTGNQDLQNFLDNCIINEKRDIGCLEEFFQQKGLKAGIYAKDKIFVHSRREQYFKAIPQELLTRSLILVDPDKGLEEIDNDESNLLFSELIDLYNRMDSDSILMFTQRFPDELYQEYLLKRTEQIKEKLEGCQPVSLDDLDTIIFFLVRNEFLQSLLLKLLRDYTQKYAKKEGQDNTQLT